MAAPRRVVIDDTDPAIQYKGPWLEDQGSTANSGNFGPAYLNTLHTMNGNGSLSFSFNGTGVFINGSNNIKNNSGVITPTWNCFVDDIQLSNPDPFQFFENNWGLCHQETLPDGPHVLTINVTAAGQTFYFDNIQYVPSSSTSLSSSTIMVDHLDPAIIYGDGWGTLGSGANMAGVNGSEATFGFVGKSLSWLGWIPTELSHAPSSGQYSIDELDPVGFSLHGLPGQNEVTQYNQIFFSTGDLTPGLHTLKVTYLGSGQTPLTISHLFVTNATVPSTSNLTMTTPAATTTTTKTTKTTAGGGSTHSTTGKTSVPVGAIAGGIIAGVAALAGLVLLAIWYRRRNRLPHIQVNPFIPPEPVTTPLLTSTHTSAPSMSSSGAVLGTGSTTSSSAYSRNPMQYARNDLETEQTTFPALRHQDSGLRIPQPEEMTELPPNYTVV